MDDDAIIAAYSERQSERGLSPDTLENYRKTHRHLSGWLRTRGLTFLTVSEEQVRGWLNEGERKPKSRNDYLTRVDLLFRWMRDESIRDDVPTRRIPKTKVPRNLPRPLPTRGLHRALELADPRTGLMLALAAYAGLRRHEIAGLRSEDFIDDGRSPMLRVRGKGQKERMVPLGPVVIEAANRYQLPDRGPVFLGQKGQAISRNTVAGIVSGHLRACGVDATTHQGRHWFGTALYAASGDLRLTQEMMGHASPATTALYAAFNPAAAVVAVSALPARQREPNEDEAA